MADEFYQSKKPGVTGQEYYEAREEAVRYDEFEHGPTIAKKSKQSMMARMRKMVYLLAACGSVAAFGFSLDTPADTAVDSSDTSIEEPVEKPTKKEDKPVKKTPLAFDDKFPRLTNLEKNGIIPAYGVEINQDFILIVKDGEERAIWQGDYFLSEHPFDVFPSSDNAYYDEASNTLYLNNFKCESINANLMGNSFTINVSGECSADLLLVWGFGYGGSVLITGDGTLTVNENLAYEVGICLEGESSESCVMIDHDVRLNVYGTEYAFYIKQTSMPKGIYCLSTKIDGVNHEAIVDYENGYHDYTLTDDSGNPITEISFYERNESE